MPRPLSYLPKKSRVKNLRRKRQLRRLRNLEKEGKLRQDEAEQTYFFEETDAPPPLRAASFGGYGVLRVSP